MPYVRKWEHENLKDGHNRWLMYRYEMSRLVKYFEDWADPEVCRKILKKEPATAEEIVALFREAVARIEDPDLCNDNCKSMYFCEKPKGHEGIHTCANGGLGWSDDD